MGTSVQWKQPSPQCAFENNSHTLFITGPTLSVKRQTIGRASSTAGGNLGHTANKGRGKKRFSKHLLLCPQSQLAHQDSARNSRAYIARCAKP